MTVLIVATASFSLTNLLPGDPAYAILGDDITPEAVETIHEELGLDLPLPLRFAKWLSHVVRGDLGHSYITKRDVASEILRAVPVTFEIMLLSMAIAIALALPLGIVSGYRAGYLADQIISFLSYALLSIPSFVMALVLIFVVTVNLRLLPPSGWIAITEDFPLNVRSAVLPALSLALIHLGIYIRLLRTEMISTLQQPYVEMARAKGIPTARILVVHALRPSAFSLITVLGIDVGALIGGSVVVETIFAAPGVGFLFFQAIQSQDYPMIQGVVLFVSTAFVTVNFCTDLLYSVLDPRIRTRLANL